MMKGENLDCCSHYSMDFRSPQAKGGCQGGNLKGAESGGNKRLGLETACRTVNRAETF